MPTYNLSNNKLLNSINTRNKLYIQLYCTYNYTYVYDFYIIKAFTSKRYYN